MRVSTSATAILFAILFTAAACSSEDGAGGAEGSPGSTMPASSEPSTGGGEDTEPAPTTEETAGDGSAAGAAEQTMRLGDQEHALESASCNLPDQDDGPFRINADTTDGKGSLLVVGVGGLGSATIQYDGVSYRSPGANPIFDGSIVIYSGQAASGPLTSDTVDFAFNVVCPEN